MIETYFLSKKADLDKQLTVEREEHHVTQQEKETAASALAKLQAQMALESQARFTDTETARQVSIEQTILNTVRS